MYSDHGHVNFPIGEVKGSGAPALVTALDVTICKNLKGLKRLCTIGALLAYLLAFEVSLPRDVVFAIMSLAKDTPSFFTDYGQSIAQVCNTIILKEKLRELVL